MTFLYTSWSMVNGKPDSRVGKKLGLDLLDFSNFEKNKQEKMASFLRNKFKPEKLASFFF